MNVQKAEMLERLSTARNFSNLDDEDNYTAASKAVRQVRPNPVYDLLISSNVCLAIFYAVSVSGN